MKKLRKVKLIFIAILFTALFAMNGRLAMKSEVGGVTLSQITRSNADFSETYYPCGLDFVCLWNPAAGGCSPKSGESVCYCFCIY